VGSNCSLPYIHVAFGLCGTTLDRYACRIVRRVALRAAHVADAYETHECFRAIFCFLSSDADDERLHPGKRTLRDLPVRVNLSGWYVISASPIGCQHHVNTFPANTEFRLKSNGFSGLTRASTLKFWSLHTIVNINLSRIFM
jgi:hypothetical protein